MCGVVPRRSCQGDAALSRGPSSLGSFTGIEPVSEPSNPYRRIEPLAGNFAFPAPIDLGGVPAPKTPDNSIEAMSWRRLHREQRAFLPLCNPDQKGSFRAALPWNHPIDQTAFVPFGNQTNLPHIGCASAYRRCTRSKDWKPWTLITSSKREFFGRAVYAVYPEASCPEIC